MRGLLERVVGRVRDPEIAIFHAFRPAPYGGSNQFLTALRDELRRRGLRVEASAIGPNTKACVLNAFAFDAGRLERTLHAGCRVVHRVDGPVSAYRGFDDGADARIVELNRCADVTVFQSQYSVDAHAELGLELRNPVVIPNAVDPAIFHDGEPEPLAGRRVRLIATSWSDNPNKGAATYAWLEEHLDWSRYELTFVGQAGVAFTRARYVPPVGSRELAELLRAHDVYLTASVNDPCSNALLEALACGLPALYRRSGGHPELVGAAGLPFDEPAEIPELLDRLVAEYDVRRGAIRVPALGDVTGRYLQTMGLA